LVGSVLRIHLEADPGINPSLEIYTAETRKGLLEEIFNVRVEFTVRNQANQPDSLVAKS
jgi:hypothetical protein